MMSRVGKPKGRIQDFILVKDLCNGLVCCLLGWRTRGGELKNFEN